jgi:imidazolonepropionase-like amidohydrolase
VRTDLSFLRESITPADFAKLEAANKDDAKAHEFWSIQARNLAKLNAAGIKIVVGTDGNTPYAPHIEMEDMVAAGMTPMQVIVAATRNGAQFLRINDAGTIEVNKSADFLVLDANPLDNITNTRKISSVYFRGAQIDRAAFRVNQTR